MPLGVVFPVAEYADVNYTATYIGAGDWNDEFRAEDGLVSTDTAEHELEFGELKGIGVLHEAMLGDYYYRIYFIPGSRLTVRNPNVDVPVPYFIWNAFFDPNEITSRNDVNADGLTNTAIVTEEFRRLELREFSITFTEDAPLTVDADYEYEFTLGIGTLNVIALRIGIFADRPEAPAERRLVYMTDVLKSWDGTEQRISIRDEPRQELSYNYFLSTETDIRRFRELLFRGLGSEYAMPLWGDGTVLASELLPGATTLDVDLSLADLFEEEYILVEAPTGETALFRVVEIDGNEVDIDTVNATTFPAGSAVFPMTRVQIEEGARLTQYPVNAGKVRLTGVAVETRALGGNGGNLITYNGIPVLEQVPLNNDQVEEAFSRMLETFDYGGKIEVYSAQLVSRIAGSRTFWIETRQDRQDMKIFLDAISGQRVPFYCPTFRDDLILHADSGNPRFLLVKSGTEVGDNFLNTYFDAEGFHVIRVKTTAGIFYQTILAVEQFDDDVIRLELTEDFDGVQTNIVQISIMRLSRLAADTVEVSDFLLDSEFTLSITTTEQ